MLLRAFALVATLALAGCADWNEQTADFATLAEFRASRYVGAVPADLMPPSTRNIHFKRNMDTTVVEVSFDFAPGDHEAVVRPFMNFDQIRLRIALAEQHGPDLPLPSMLMRCGDGPMEFLQIDKPGHALYWTDIDKQRRQRSCTNGATRPGSAA